MRQRPHCPQPKIRPSTNFTVLKSRNKAFAANADFDALRGCKATLVVRTVDVWQGTVQDRGTTGATPEIGGPSDSR